MPSTREWKCELPRSSLGTSARQMSTSSTVGQRGRSLANLNCYPSIVTCVWAAWRSLGVGGKARQRGSPGECAAASLQSGLQHQEGRRRTGDYSDVMGDAPKVAAPCHFAGIGGQKTALCAVSDSQQAPGRAQPAADLLEMNTGLNRTRGRKAASFGAGVLTPAKNI